MEGKIKFIVPFKEFLEALSMLDKAADSKNVLPVLDNFLFEVKDDLLKVTVSNLETTTTRKIYLEDYTGEGVFMLPRKAVKMLKNKKTDRPITVEVDMESGVFDVFFENSKLSFVAGLKVKDFPQLPELGEVKQTLVKHDLYDDLLRLIRYVASDGLRPFFNTVHAVTYNGFMELCASNAFILLITPTHKKSEGSYNFGDISKILKVFKGSEIKVSFYENQTVVSDGRYEMITRQIGGNLSFSFRQPIPQSHKSTVKAYKQDVLSELDMLQSAANQLSHFTTFETFGNILTLSSHDIDSGHTYSVKLNCESTLDIKMNFKIPFLKTVLQSIKNDEFVMEYNDNHSGVFFREDDDIHLLMPYNY